jgi:hypothetical protein
MPVDRLPVVVDGLEVLGPFIITESLYSGDHHRELDKALCLYGENPTLTKALVLGLRDWGCLESYRGVGTIGCHRAS